MQTQRGDGVALATNACTDSLLITVSTGTAMVHLWLTPNEAHEVILMLERGREVLLEAQREEAKP